MATVYHAKSNISRIKIIIFDIDKIVIQSMLLCLSNESLDIIILLIQMYILIVTLNFMTLLLLEDA